MVTPALMRMVDEMAAGHKVQYLTLETDPNDVYDRVRGMMNGMVNDDYTYLKEAMWD